MEEYKVKSNYTSKVKQVPNLSDKVELGQHSIDFSTSQRFNSRQKGYLTSSSKSSSSIIFDDHNAPVEYQDGRVSVKQISKNLISIKSLTQDKQLVSPSSSENITSAKQISFKPYSQRVGGAIQKENTVSELFDTQREEFLVNSPQKLNKLHSPISKSQLSLDMRMAKQNFQITVSNAQYLSSIPKSDQKSTTSGLLSEQSMTENSIKKGIQGAFNNSIQETSMLSGESQESRSDSDFKSKLIKKLEKNRTARVNTQDDVTQKQFDILNQGGTLKKSTNQFYFTKNFSNSKPTISDGYSNSSTMQFERRNNNSLLNSSTVKKQVINRGDVSHIDSHSATQMDYPKCHDKIYDSMLLSPNEIQNIHKKRTNQDKFWVKSKTKKFKRELQIKSDQFSFVKK